MSGSGAWRQRDRRGAGSCVLGDYYEGSPDAATRRKNTSQTGQLNNYYEIIDRYCATGMRKVIILHVVTTVLMEGPPNACYAHGFDHSYISSSSS